ncbi:hypothetical protein B5S31_g890 [[Candida] boidinii]|nr:hypothetical protein B5S31_g890 [[Candida] boidinii]
MLDYMEYVEKCFYQATGWDEDNTYGQLLASSRNLLYFPIPKGFKLDVSSRSTEYSYSSATLSQLNRLSGSVSYLYCSKNLNNVFPSSSVPLRNTLNSYKIVRQYQTKEEREALTKENYKPVLFYGKLYFPSQFLEAMMIKRFTNTQLIVKCISTPRSTNKKGSGIITMYLQREVGKSSQEFIYSSNESLLGFRFLYNLKQKLDQDFPKTSNINKIFNYDGGSSLAFGAEIWYAALSRAPGISTALRYCTHITSIGNPLTITISLNPLLGSMSASYAIKTSIGSTFCSKYDFNIYSYESDLTLGCDLWRLKEINNSIPNKKSSSSSSSSSTNSKSIRQQRTRDPHSNSHNNHGNSHLISDNSNNMLFHQTDNTPYYPLEPLPLLDDELFNKVHEGKKFNLLKEEEHHRMLNSFMHVKPGRWLGENAARNFINDFQQSDFSSAFKANTSIKSQNLNILWEGRFKDFLLSFGCKLDWKDSVPKLGGYGLQFQYNS